MFSMVRTVVSALLDRGKFLLLVILSDYLVCGMLFNIVEHRGFIKSMWWAIVTGFTVGYGDVYPATTAGRGIGAFLIVSAWFLSIIASAFITATIIQNRDLWTHAEQEATKNALLRLLIHHGLESPDTKVLPGSEELETV